MKTKLVLWGANGADEKILIAISLKAEDNKLDIYTFPEKVATEDFYQRMMKEWRNGAEVEFPEGFTHLERELSITESLLPEDIKVERGDVIQRAQTEWHFVVLSSKLNTVYQTELSELKGKIEGLEAYSQETWDNLKEFWNKVQGQVRERNLFREHADSLRDNTNELFAKLKELRSKMDDEFKSRSKEHLDTFMNALEEIEGKITGGMRLQGLFDDLKGLQRKFRETKLTKEHRSQIWERLDKGFKSVKAKRFGDSAMSDSSPTQRLERRYNGLLAAIEKMERSIRRDRDDLDFQKRKIERTDGQLEAQIRAAKIKMIEERVRSKEEKLNEMHQTKTELEQKMERQKEKDAKRAERDAREAAKSAAAEKIKEKIAAEAAARVDDSEKLEKAAEQIVEDEKKKGAKPKESLIEAVSTTVGESLEDVVDTVKAVASVVGDKVEDAVEDLKEKVAAEEGDEKSDSALGSVVGKMKAVAAVVSDKVEDAVEDLKDKVMSEEAGEKASSIIENVVEKAKEVAEKVSEKVEEMSEKVEDVVEEVSDKVEDKVEELKDKVTGEKEASVDDIAEEVSDKVEEAIEEIKEKASDEEE